MILDYESAEVPTDVESQICIVGGGPAGITLALELAKSGMDVALLEGGGTTPTAESQRLYAGKNVGTPYFPLDACRLRVLGGSSGHWSGWCGALDESDFYPKDWIPMSGWPIAKADLDDHYRKAHHYLNLGPFEYDLDYWESEFSNFPDFEKSNLIARILQFSSPPVRFGTAYLDQLESNDRIRVYLNANATRLGLSKDGARIESVDIRSLGGRRGVAKAAQYVVACGGIENPRLLLASNDVNRNGVGNDRGLVGRFFMEHPEAPCARIFNFDARQMNEFGRLATDRGRRLAHYLAQVPKSNEACRSAMAWVSSTCIVSRTTFPKTAGPPIFPCAGRWGDGKLPESAGAKLGLWLRDFDTLAACCRTETSRHRTRESRRHFECASRHRTRTVASCCRMNSMISAVRWPTWIGNSPISTDARLQDDVVDRC